MVFPGMAGQSRVEFLQAQALAAAPSVAHGIALKRYSSACGRRDLRTEALVSSDESGDSDAGSMVAQSSNAVQAVKPALPAPPPGMDPSYRRPRYFHSWLLHARISLWICLS